MGKIIGRIKKGLSSLTSTQPDLEPSTIEEVIGEKNPQNFRRLEQQLKEAQRQAEKIMQGGFAQSMQNPAREIEQKLGKMNQKGTKKVPTRKDSEIER